MDAIRAFLRRLVDDYDPPPAGLPDQVVERLAGRDIERAA